MMEDVQDLNWAFLRKPILGGVVGGVGVASYMMLWPPGVMLLFTFGVFVVLQLSREHLEGRPTDHLALGTMVTMVVAGLLTLLYARSYTLESTAYSLIQPLVAFGIVAGTAVLFALSRYAEREGYERRYYPPAVAGLVVASLALAWLVFPRSIQLLRSLFVRVYSFGYFTSVTAGTVAEIQPATLQSAFTAYGVILIIALVGFLLLVKRVVGEDRPIDLLVVLWSLTMFSAYFTMARFGYYFAVNVAILAAFGIWWAWTRWLDIEVDVHHIQEADVGMYQIIGVLIILVLVIPGNVVPMQGRQPVWDMAENPSLSGTNQAWYGGMQWMEGNTPAVPMGYYDQYERPPDGDFDYPEGAYGVMSWWDYGHWITVMGKRIPYANPFQQNPRPASAYFQATNETRADLILEALPSFSEDPGEIRSLSSAQLRDVVSGQEESQARENGRYVVIDDQMAGGKFAAITRWAGPNTGTYFQNGQYQFQGQNVSLPQTSQRYDRTMLSRLYYRDAGGLSHYRLVHEVDQYSLVGGYIQGQRIRTLTSISPPGWNWDAAKPVASQMARSRGGIVSLGQGSGQYVYNSRVESRVKIYERVEGATLTGTVPGGQNGTPVVAYVQLQTHTGRVFTYVQQTRTGPDGSFEMTVPYATDDGVGLADGGTNSSVRATGEYTVQAGTLLSQVASGSVAVPETAVYDGSDVPVTLEPAQQGNESASSGNESTGAGSGTDASGSSPSGSGNESSAGGNDTASSLAADRRLVPAEP